MTDGRFRISNTAVAGGASVTPGVTSASATISTNTRVASGADMSLERLKAGLVTIIVGVAGASAALAADGEVVIGNLDDLSGFYSDDGGSGSVEAEKMAIADFGGTVLGRKIVALVADHHNKPDIGASRFREWADQKGLNMMIAGANTGVAIAMTKVAVAK